MTYNRRKINTKGEKAPNGYHYMADDSLMSDEEHEKRYGKFFAKTLDCSDCRTAVFSTGVFSQTNEVTLANPWDTSAQLTVNHPEFGFGDYWNSGEIAKHGNKIWTKWQSKSVQDSGTVNIIKEFTISKNCTIDFVRNMTFPSSVFEPGIGTGGLGFCAAAQFSSSWQVLYLSNVRFSTSYLQYLVSLGVAPSVLSFAGKSCTAKVGLPPLGATTPIWIRPIYETHHAMVGDIVSVPSSNTMVTIGERWPGTGAYRWWLKHYDSNGNLLGNTEVPLSISNSGGGASWTLQNLFSYGDDVYFRGSLGGSGTSSPAPIYHWDLSTYVITPTVLSAPWAADAASDPSCFLEDPFTTNTPTSWDCGIVGYQSKKPHAPIYGCVEKTYPQVGQFATQQDCIDSHCGSTPTGPIPTGPSSL
jgi:hypothetical protein